MGLCVVEETTPSQTGQLIDEFVLMKFADLQVLRLLYFGWDRIKPAYSFKEIQSEIGLPYRSTRSILDRMRSKGLINSFNAFGGYYHAVEDPHTQDTVRATLVTMMRKLFVPKDI